MLHVKRYQYSTGSEKVARPLLIPRYLTLAVHCTEATREPSADSLSEAAPDHMEVADDSEPNSPIPEPAAFSASSSSALFASASLAKSDLYNGKVIVPAQLKSGTSTTCTASTVQSRMPSSSSGYPSPHSRTGVKPEGMRPLEFDSAISTSAATTNTVSTAGVRPTAAVNGTLASSNNGSSTIAKKPRASASSTASTAFGSTGGENWDNPDALEPVFAGFRV